MVKRLVERSLCKNSSAKIISKSEKIYHLKLKYKFCLKRQ